jgi:regulator of nucleoside diphosphate kinase
MITITNAAERPPLHLLASESDLVAELALKSEHSYPVVSSMLLQEIERAELHDADTLPAGHVRLNSHVTFVDEKSGRLREVQVVLPGNANIEEGRLSILTPMGAALYGLAAGHTIEWPDLEGRTRPIRIVEVADPQ